KVFNSWINCIHQRFQGVFSTLKVVRKGYVSLIISVLPMSNIKLPLCKFLLCLILCKFLLCLILTQTHVDFQIENCELLPEHRTLKASSHNLWSCTSSYDRQYLLKVSTKDNTQPPKRIVTSTNVLSSPIH